MRIRAFIIHILTARRWQKVEEWSEQDAVWLTNALRAPSGQKLLAILKNQEIENNAQAVISSRLEYAAGYAAGARGFLAHILSLSATLPPDPQQNNPEVGEEFERFQP